MQEEKREWQEIKNTNVFEFYLGKVVEGVLVSRDELKTEFKDQSILYSLEIMPGEVKSFFGTTMLNNLMKQVKIGDLVKVEYVGKRMGKGGFRSYHEWKVYKAQGPQTAIPSKEVS